MNILFVISSISIGGEQRVASIITKFLTDNGHTVDMITFKTDKKKIRFDSNVNVIHLQKKRYFDNISRISLLRKHIKKNKYDIVIGFAIIPSILCSLAAARTTTPVVICERNDPKNYKLTWKIIRRLSYKLAYAAVFQTRDAHDYFGDNFFKLSKIIPNPIIKTNLPIRDKQNINHKIVNTARLVKAKNHKMLIEAFSKISNKFPEHTLHIYGDGPLKKNLNELVNSLGLEDKVFLHDADPNVLEKIKNSSLFVLTSNNEGFPNSLAEALAIGIPSISTDCRIGGPKDMIEDNENGFLIPVGDVDALAQVMGKVLQSKNVQERISDESRKICNELDVEIIGNNWIEFLSSITSSFKKGQSK
jgi:glycosyltransferase involved in cell wall biosynthesis